MVEDMETKSQELFGALWGAADEMRKIMSADVYKDYLLGLIFYKALSDMQLEAVVDLLEDRKPASMQEAQSIYEKAQNSDSKDDLQEELRLKFGCVIAPQHTFTAFYNHINDGTFLIKDLSEAFIAIEQSGISKDGHKPYQGLFDDFDIYSKDLGKTDSERNALLSAVIKRLYALNFSTYGADALGDAYEYLIGKFASESGKKAGEFYTPQAVSKLITRIVTHGKEKQNGFTIYDPCMGSGSLLLQVKNYIHRVPDNDQEDYTRHIQFFGQEIKNQTFNLAKMNMILHQVPTENQHLRQGDTLDADWPTDEPTNFDAVVMNPPYSQNWSAKEAMLQDVRFARYERLAPKGKADLAFLLHGFYHLKEGGCMGIVQPHGVLFRGAAEGVIRKHLLEDGSIYAVIGLPANIFYNTTIPTCVIILRKDNPNRDVLFIDASKEFEKGKNQNTLTDANIEKIVNAFLARKDIDKYAHLASFEEIKKNDFNLNIPRYVDTFEEEEEIDLKDVFEEIKNVDKEISDSNAILESYFKELGITDSNFGEK